MSTLSHAMQRFGDDAAPQSPAHATQPHVTLIGC